jgi:hypothetical protein
MRTTVPQAFTMSFTGPEGPYALHFRPTDEWDGIIDVTIGGLAMRWSVDEADVDETGGTVLGGMTSGSDEIWNDTYWFELRLAETPPVMRYWGDKVIWREDRAAA